MPASLVDAFTRHQIYLEGYKDGQDPSLDPILQGLFAAIAGALGALGVATLNELTRNQLTQLIRRVNNVQKVPQSKFKRRFVQEMRVLASAEVNIQTKIMETIEGKTKAQARKDAPSNELVLGLLATKSTAPGNKRLWGLIKSTPDPASGLKPLEMINQYLAYIRRNMSQIITRGYANSTPVSEVLAEMFGTRKRRFKDGFTARAARQGASAMRTIIQHISSRVQAGIASLFYRQYEWVAVLDNGTTAICRSRDGRVYLYGKGPLPPAHYRCRSRAVPLPNGANYSNSPASFHGWLKGQPLAFQTDILGPRLGKRLNSNRLTAKQLGKFRSNKLLTLDQFIAKSNLMLTT